MGRRLALRLTMVPLGLLVLVALLGVSMVGPYMQDDRHLDQLVRAVALDWRDFGLERAQSRLQYELDRQRVGLQVADNDCTFEEPADRVREVRCQWHADVPIPLVARTFPMDFVSQARIEPDGDLTW